MSSHTHRYCHGMPPAEGSNRRISVTPLPLTMIDEIALRSFLLKSGAREGCYAYRKYKRNDRKTFRIDESKIGRIKVNIQKGNRSPCTSNSYKVKF